MARVYLCARELKLSCSSLEFGEGVMDRKSVLSAHRLATYLPIIVCGIVALLSAGAVSAEDGADKGGIDAKSFAALRK